MIEHNVKRAREKFRNQVPPGYSHINHLMKLMLLTIVPVVIFSLLLSQMTVPLLALLMIPLGLVIGNFFEYIAHRWPMHKLLWGGYMYHRHAGIHHVMFKHDSMELDDPRDWHHVMMPVASGTTFMVIITALTTLTYLFVSSAAACIVGITLCLYILSEELLHLSFHLKSTWERKNVMTKTLAWLGEHHKFHHNSRFMRKYAFNVAFPLFDSILKTRRPGEEHTTNKV